MVQRAHSALGRWSLPPFLRADQDAHPAGVDGIEQIDLGLVAIGVVDKGCSGAEAWFYAMNIDKRPEPAVLVPQLTLASPFRGSLPYIFEGLLLPQHHDFQVISPQQGTPGRVGSLAENVRHLA
jgi:hypothetical protein